MTDDTYILADEIQALEEFLYEGVNPTRANLAWECIQHHVVSAPVVDLLDRPISLRNGTER